MSKCINQSRFERYAGIRNIYQFISNLFFVIDILMYSVLPLFHKT